MIIVLGSDSSNWLDWATAIGTVGAAVFAGFAAVVSAVSTRQTRDIVEIERDRDRDAAERARLEQVKAVMVGMNTEEVFDGDRRIGADCRLVLTNGSSLPIYKARLKMIVGGVVWGPQLVGDVAPGQRVEVYARILTTEDQADTDALVRFTDARGEAWVCSARGRREPDPTDVQAWIDEGMSFRPTTRYEKGMMDGVSYPDFDVWREFAEGDE